MVTSAVETERERLRQHENVTASDLHAGQDMFDLASNIQRECKCVYTSCEVML